MQIINVSKATVLRSIIETLFFLIVQSGRLVKVDIPKQIM